MLKRGNPERGRFERGPNRRKEQSESIFRAGKKPGDIDATPLFRRQPPLIADGKGKVIRPPSRLSPDTRSSQERRARK